MSALKMWTVGLFLPLLFSASVRAQWQSTFEPNQVQGPNYVIKVQQVEPATSMQGTLYHVTYDYEFKGRDSVWVGDLGAIPAKGRFSYWTAAKDRLEFRDSAGSQILVSVPLKETVSTRSIDLPPVSDFPAFYRAGTWKLPASFQENALRVLNEQFGEGFLADRDKNLTQYLTTYTALSNLPQGLRAEIAVLVSHPYDEKRQVFTFHIQHVSRENRSHSPEWRPGTSDEVKRAANSFINQLLTELEAVSTKDAGGKK